MKASLVENYQSSLENKLSITHHIKKKKKKSCCINISFCVHLLREYWIKNSIKSNANVLRRKSCALQFLFFGQCLWVENTTGQSPSDRKRTSRRDSDLTSPVWGTVVRNNWWPRSLSWSCFPLCSARNRRGWPPAAPRPWWPQAARTADPNDVIVNTSWKTADPTELLCLLRHDDCRL